MFTGDIGRVAPVDVGTMSLDFIKRSQNKLMIRRKCCACKLCNKSRLPHLIYSVHNPIFNIATIQIMLSVASHAFQLRSYNTGITYSHTTSSKALLK